MSCSCLATSLAYLGVMALLRGLLLYTNLGLAEQIPLVDLTRTFLVGLRFDLIITCILGTPLVLALLLPGGLGTRRLALLWLGITGALTLFAGVSELEFYREFHTRLNSIAFHYLQEDAATVSSMIWNGYPVVRYLLLWLLLSGIYITVLRWIDRHTPKRPVAGYRVAMRVPVFFLILLLAVWGGRGTLRSGPPLRWGDAFHSQHLFANHLALNGTYTLAKAAMAAKDSCSGRRLADRHARRHRPGNNKRHAADAAGHPAGTGRVPAAAPPHARSTSAAGAEKHRPHHHGKFFRRIHRGPGA